MEEPPLAGDRLRKDSGVRARPLSCVARLTTRRLAERGDTGLRGGNS